MKKKYQADINLLLSWVHEAQTAHQMWRKDSWEDWEFRDGKQWSQAAYAAMEKKGIKPVTINRTFPIINLVHGHYLINQQDIVALGRTKHDAELGQVMSEGIQLVVDQNGGTQKMGNAFHDQIVAGFGCMGVDINPDPRREVVQLNKYPWYSIWWDPYASPWMDKDHCRYVFHAAWKDLHTIMAIFPEKAKEIQEIFGKLSSEAFVPDVYDEGTEVEDYKRYMSSGHWVNQERKRIRPIEMWYTNIEKSWFALMNDGRALDLDSLGGVREQYAAIQAAREVVSANVKKMRVATFLNTLLIQDIPSPYVHDEYPYVPFVGYLDRYDYPFGIPRQIKEQDMEINKRRSMALSLLSNRRVIIEEKAAKDVNKVYDEANRQDGFIVLKPGKKGAFEIQELGTLASGQIELQRQSESEIKEISGANDEMLGYETHGQSGVAIEKKQQQAATITASLLENARISQKMLGERVTALIQNRWTEEKILRVTDRVTGAEKFVAINERVYSDGAIEIKNNITQARFDIQIASRPMTDTMREKNMELIFSAINKSPAEAVGPLLNLALEISDIPNKDLLLKQIRSVTGVNPIRDDLTIAEREALEQAEAEELKVKQEEQYQLEMRDKTLDLDNKQAEVEKTRAETEEIRAKIGTEKQIADTKSFETGSKIGLELLKGGKPGEQGTRKQETAKPASAAK
jgi:hypothetical protein